MKTSWQNRPSVSGMISGYASFFNITDQHQDHVVRGAFSRTLKSWRAMGKTPKMLWQHDPKVPIGKWLNLYEDDKGLYVEGKLALGLKQADEAYFLIKEGILEGLSIGFRTIKAVKDSKNPCRLLLDIDLLEISLVTFGANTCATVRQVKQGAGCWLSPALS